MERPASVVKELLENSIDAGASSVTVEIRGGGIDEIVVADDGCGMAPDDARDCFLRHATSKIASEEDLDGIATLGFRGEALAAISAVSRIELTTRPREQELGTRLYLEAGEVLEKDECACAAGTVIRIRNLFYNTPARMKFLRKDGKEALSTAGDGDLESAVYSICGREFAAGLEEVTGSPNANVHVWGYVTRPECARATRNMQYIFLNGRSIQSRTVMAALEEAYRGHSTTGKFPGCVLHLALDPELVDANVHPAKLEVKFADEHAIFEAVYYAVRAALEKKTARPEFHLKEETVPVREVQANTKTFEPRVSAPVQQRAAWMEQTQQKPAPGMMAPAEIWAHLREDSAKTAAVLTQNIPVLRPFAVSEPEAEPDEEIIVPPIVPSAALQVCTSTAEVVRTPVSEEEIPVQTVEAEPAVQEEPEIQPCPDFKVLGELFGAYIVAETAGEALIIDKHAAHERIRYEQLLREQEQGSAPAVQTLLTPVVLTLEPAEAAAVAENEELLRSYGVDAENFGGHDLVIRELPADVSPAQAAALVTELARALRQTNRAQLREVILHRLACHSAIRAGEYTTMAEMEALVRIVLTTPSLRHCPHGRPVAMTMSKQDFIRNFER